MKVGILTLPLTDNYGGILQAAALIEVLCQAGHEPELLDYRPSALGGWRALLYPVLQRIPGQNIRHIRAQYLKMMHLRPFITRCIPKSPLIRTSADLNAWCVSAGYEALVCGSDQVWRYRYISHALGDYFLAFAPTGVLRVAYAASFGKADWEAPQVLPGLRPLMQQFDAVSVRETSGSRLCRDYFDYDNTTTALDPTLLHDADFYRQLYRATASELPAVKVAHYLLDPSTTKYQLVEHIRRYAQASESEVFALGRDQTASPAVETWLATLDQAQYVVTDSFHGLVFALIFGKQVLVCVNHERGTARMTELLQALGLESLLIYPGQSLPEIPMIDYDTVSARLSVMIHHSRLFLRRALSTESIKRSGLLSGADSL